MKRKNVFFKLVAGHRDIDIVLWLTERMKSEFIFGPGVLLNNLLYRHNIYIMAL